MHAGYVHGSIHISLKSAIMWCIAVVVVTVSKLGSYRRILLDVGNFCAEDTDTHPALLWVQFRRCDKLGAALVNSLMWDDTARTAVQKATEDKWDISEIRLLRFTYGDSVLACPSRLT